MTWAMAPLEVSNGSVLVRTLRHSDIESVIKAIHDPEGWSGRIWGIDTAEKIREMLVDQLESHTQGECHPFVYFVGDEVAGISRFLHIAPARKTLEVGGTCVAPKWRRTCVNTEVKSLLFKHAFENLNVIRVELRVDCMNYVSQMNVLRLGAKFEGKIRHWQIRKSGELPDGMLYSITNKEWPEVQERLRRLRFRELLEMPFLPAQLETPDLKLSLFQLSDAGELLDLVRRNQESLVESFPQTAVLDTIKATNAYIAERAHLAAAGITFCYGVRLKRNRRLMAQFQIKNVNWKNLSAEMGYFVDSEFRRQGFASQMIKTAVEELTQKGFKRITLRSVITNKASIGLALKLGFIQEGILKSEFVTGTGEWVDSVLFSKTPI